VTLVLDAGALLALEKNDRAMWRRFKSVAWTSGRSTTALAVRRAHCQRIPA
jgi:hypothetical protein